MVDVGGNKALHPQHSLIREKLADKLRIYKSTEATPNTLKHDREGNNTFPLSRSLSIRNCLILFIVFNICHWTVFLFLCALLRFPDKIYDALITDKN